MSFPPRSLDLARALLRRCEAERIRLVTAESCTAGLIAACLTEIAGSSAVVDRGWIVYDNRAKQELLGVPGELFERVGAVSEEVARAMAEGALERSGADLALACTGIAGPGGATPAKPAGLVHTAAARRGGATRQRRDVFPGHRQTVRAATVDAALELALEILNEPG